MESNPHNRLLEVLQYFGKVKPFFPRADDLPQGEFFLLHKIACCQKKERPGVRISTISNTAHMSMPAVSQMLNLLESKGLIERCVDKGDRRAVFVNVTEKGENLMQDVMQKVIAMTSEIEERLGKQDTERFIDISIRIFTIMQEIKSREGLQNEQEDEP